MSLKTSRSKNAKKVEQFRTDFVTLSFKIIYDYESGSGGRGSQLYGLSILDMMISSIRKVWFLRRKSVLLLSKGNCENFCETSKESFAIVFA